jgi:hypothetical protein
MQTWPNGIELLALLLEAAGVLLLFREVWRGHEAERHASTYAQLERIEQPMRLGGGVGRKLYLQETHGRTHPGCECLWGNGRSGGIPQGDREPMAGRARRPIPVFTTEVALLD